MEPGDAPGYFHLRDIAADQPRLPVLVGVAWLALILSMGLNVSSYPISKHAVEQRWNHNQKRGDLLSERAWRRSLAAGVSLSLGALLVAAFAWLNLIA